MIGVVGLHHVAMTVTELERARGFYGEVLGLEELARPQLGSTGIWYRCGDNQIHIIVAREPRGNSQRHIALDVGDVKKAYDALLKARDVEIVGPPEYRESDGTRFTFFRDPDGNMIELRQAQPP